MEHGAGPMSSVALIQSQGMLAAQGNRSSRPERGCKQDIIQSSICPVLGVVCSKALPACRSLWPGLLL